ncbi:MAG: hypothetical protein JOS17DRAFT_118098 [Linnemannia elongata]|nr:MAG: hypothetical protein JOS17DRAFT_118098 [Linnemannia elongata]
MLSFTAASARSKVQAAVNALVEGRYHDLIPWASGPLQQQQRNPSFTEGHEQLQDRLSDFFLLWCDGGVAGKPDQQRQDGKEEQERYILQWLKEMKSSRSQDHGRAIVLDHCCETSPVFQRPFDSGVDVEVDKQTTTLSRTLVLVLVGQVRASAQLLDRSVGVVLVVEDEKEVPWKFQGVVCVTGSEEGLVSQGWRRMQGDTTQSVSSMINTAAPIASTTCRIQEQQYQKSAGRYCDEEDDDSDDDYWGQYEDLDSDHEDAASGKSSNDSSPTETVTFPSSSSAGTTFSPASTYYSPSTTGAVKASEVISMAVNIISTTTSTAHTASFASRPNNYRWEEVNEVDEDDDDEYWGKYGDHDEPEPEQKQQPYRGQGQDSESPPQDSSHDTDNIYDIRAERQKIDPTVHTAQKEALRISSEAALPDSAFLALVAPVPVVPEPGQVDPTALTLRLMNLIVHHADSTGYLGAAGVHEDQRIYSEDEDEDIDDQLADKEESMDDYTSSRSRTRGGFLIRLDSRLQQHDDSAAETPLESEHQPHTNHTDDKDEQREWEESGDTQAPSTLFSASALVLASHSRPKNTTTTTNNNNIKEDEAGSCTSPPSASSSFFSSQSRFESQSLSTTISTSSSLPPAHASLPNPSISSFPPPPQHSPHFTYKRQQQQEQQNQHQKQEQQQYLQESLSPSSCTDSAFQECLDQSCDNNNRINNNYHTNNNNNNNNKNISSGCTSISERGKEKEEEREQFLSSLRSMAQEAKVILGLTKAEFLNFLDRAYDSPAAFTTTTSTTTTH